VLVPLSSRRESFAQLASHLAIVEEIQQVTLLPGFSGCMYDMASAGYVAGGTVPKLPLDCSVEVEGTGAVDIA
jgi:hypothetical protein